MPFRCTDTSTALSRPRARAPTALVAAVGALVAFGPAAAASEPFAGGDADCDGTVNASDNCPTEVEDFDGHADEDGCPDPDNDGDVIADSSDRCPDEAEVFNGFEDDDGCPDAATEIGRDRIELKQQIHFAFDTAEILARNDPTLDEIARTIREHPEVETVRIEGHADDRRSSPYNQELSERRASVVYGRLVGLGIEPARLVHVGHGATRRVTVGGSARARAQNRRVEFLVEFASPDTPGDRSVRDEARVRASLRPRTSHRAATVMSGCTTMSFAASEAALREARPVEDMAATEPLVRRSTLLPLPMSFTVGGGLTSFSDRGMREVADIAGSWEARLTLGTRQWVGVEAAYVGSAQTVDVFGLGEDARLVSHGFGAALRVNLRTGQYRPYLLAGGAWRRYNVMNTRFNTSSMNDEGDVLETPVGVGFSCQYKRLILDGRVVYRRVFREGLLQATADDGPELHTWTANLMAGFEF